MVKYMAIISCEVACGLEVRHRYLNEPLLSDILNGK